MSEPYFKFILPEIDRWTPSRKYMILDGLFRERFTLDEVMQKYSLSRAEIDEWHRQYNQYGVQGLRSTRTGLYRLKDL